MMIDDCDPEFIHHYFFLFKNRLVIESQTYTFKHLGIVEPPELYQTYLVNKLNHKDWDI